MVFQGHQRHQGRHLFSRSGPQQKSPSVIPIDIESNESPDISAETDLPEELVESSINPSPEAPELESSELESLDFTALEVAEIPGEEVGWDPLAEEGIEIEEVLEDSTIDSGSLNSEQPAANGQEEETSVETIEETTEITIETSSEAEISDLEENSVLDNESIDPVTESELEEDAIVAEVDDTDADTESEETTDDSEEEEFIPVETVQNAEFTSGVFTVGDTGEVTVDFLFDGGGYQGELAIFSLDGMEEFDPGSEEFIREAAGRALSNSTSGYVVFSDQTEGAKFTGELGEGNSNSGEYLGAKTFTMRAGDKFGFMLVANGRVQQVFDDPTVGGALRPLFSMATANPDDAFHVGQIADVTGDGKTFVMEDLRVDEGTDRDYNDLIFQVRGATGTAINLDEVIDPAKDWRSSDLGKEIVGVTNNISETEDINPVDEQPVKDDPIVENPVDEQPVPFDQELWDFITGQESPADPLPEGVELPNNQQPTWVKQLGSVELDRSRGIAVDSSGNVYMAGGTLGSLDGNTSAIGINGSSDPFLTKYDINGNKLWTQQLGSTGWDYYNAVTVDNAGNVYTVGYDDGPNTSGGGDATFTKWDSNGNRLWSKSIGSSQSQDFASDVTVDSAGNILITGMNDRSVGVVGGNADAFVAKYNSNGNEVWTRQLGTALQDQARSVTTDAAGNVYIAGITEGSLDGNVSAGGTDVFVSKYDPSGNKIWTRQLGTASSDGYVSYAGNGEFERNVSIAVDSTGGVYVSGTTEGSLDGNVNSGGRDAFVTKYDSFGTKNWTRQLGTTGEDRSMGVAVDSTGKVYISGWTTGNLDGNINSGSTDAFVTRYDSLGNKILTLLLGTTAVDASRDVAVDRTGNVYLSGWTESSLGGNAAGNLDAFVAKYATLQPNRSPVVSSSDQTISTGITSNVDFFTVSDADGDTIQQYYFADNNSSATSGYFTLNGFKQTAGFSVAASQLVNVKFVGGSQGGTESIKIGAYDGKAWGYRDINITTQDKQSVVNNGGWWADYYQGDFQQYKSSEQLPDQAAWGKLFKSWGHGGPVGMTDNFSVRLTGQRYFEPGQHLITAGADDRIRVRIDGKEIITAWAFGAPGKQVYFDSPGGYHTIEIDYKEDVGSAVVSLDWLLTKPLQANRAPVVTTTNRTLNTNASIPVSNLFTFSDPDGDTIQTYHFGELDSSTTSGGYLTYKGVRLTGGRWVQVNASQLADVKFVAGPQAGSDRINIQVYDGKTWSNFTSVTLTTQQANRAPVVTTSNRSLNIGTSTAASNFFTVTDPDGDTIQRYYFSDITSGSASGYFMLNGVKQTSPFYADASQLANVQFVAGSQAGTDTVAIQAYDGKAWSNFPSATITTQQPNRAPVVTTTNQTLNTGTSIGTNFFTVSDLDGDAIQQYYFYDSNSSENSGYFTVNGIKQTGTFFVSSNQLASVRFVAGLQAGTDTVYVQASDGKAWSNFPGTIITTQQANRAPVVTTTNRTLDTGTSTAVSNFFTVSDADGDTIQRYYFSDGTSDSTSGYFTLNGVRQTSPFYADASQLASVRFVAGSQAGTDTVAIQAYDGKAWSNFPSATITTKTNTPPRVIPINRTVNIGTTNNADFFTVSDPDGDAIQSYYFYDNNTSSTSGYFLVNGVRQAAGFFVAASQLANVKFIGGSQASSDSITTYAYDGKTWSNGANSILTTQQANRLPIINVSNQSVNANQSVNLAFTATDPDGDAITRYQFWDSNTNSSSGYFTVNGVRQPAGQSIEVAANQLSTVRFVGGSLAGSDSLWIRAFDNKDWSNWQNFSMATTASQNPQFTSFNVTDASGDSTANTVFQGGAIKFNYSLANSTNLSSVRLEAVRNGSVIANLGTWNGASASNQLVNLANFSSLTGGDYQIRAVARTTSGQEVISSVQSMKVLSTNRVNGTFAGETLTYAGGLGTGGVIIGRGGTDTLNLSGISRSSVTSINGMSLSSFNPWSGSTNSQAIFGGNALDYITLADGREVYFQGIDRLRFSDGTEMDMQIRPNDTHFAQQWNLQITDVTSAWRFTQGSSSILLSSLDSGLTPPPSDINSNRLILRSNGIDNDDFNDYGHGAVATSVMASTTNNSSGVAGINWNSQVIVNDLYGGNQRVNRVSLFEAINSSIKAARTTGKKIVFQGGVQGEGWLNNFQTLGATQAQLEQLIRDNSDVALFAVAAGNGGSNGNLEDFNYLNSVSGFAKLETNHSNVISVGALKIGTPQPGWGNSGTDYNFVNGLLNASSVSLTEYSNRGSNLTLVAPTNSPAMTKLGDMTYFGGTSAANPNMAGIASLVWSVNSKLTGGEVRQILIDTAMDLGTAGRDNTFGNGLVNADAAVRRAWALEKDSQVANLYSGRSVIA